MFHLIAEANIHQEITGGSCVYLKGVGFQEETWRIKERKWVIGGVVKG